MARLVFFSWILAAGLVAWTPNARADKQPIADPCLGAESQVKPETLRRARRDDFSGLYFIIGYDECGRPTNDLEITLNWIRRGLAKGMPIMRQLMDAHEVLGVTPRTEHLDDYLAAYIELAKTGHSRAAYLACIDGTREECLASHHVRLAQCEQALDAGEAGAGYFLGLLYMTGTEDIRPEKVTQRWLDGDRPMTELPGVARDPDKAREFLSRAAALGHADAAALLREK